MALGLYAWVSSAKYCFQIKHKCAQNTSFGTLIGYVNILLLKSRPEYTLAGVLVIFLISLLCFILFQSCDFLFPTYLSHLDKFDINFVISSSVKKYSISSLILYLKLFHF